MRCPECGNDNEQSAAYCTQCGCSLAGHGENREEPGEAERAGATGGTAGAKGSPFSRKAIILASVVVIAAAAAAGWYFMATRGEEPVAAEDGITAETTGEEPQAPAPVLARGNPGQTGVLAGTGFEPVGQVRWTYGGAERSLAPPLATGQLVFFTTSDPAAAADGAGTTLRAVDPSSGEARWSRRFGGGKGTAPVYFDGSVYVGGRNGLYAFDAASGEARWQPGENQDTRAYDCSPVIADGVIYYAFSAYDAATHEKIWQFDPGESATGTQAVAGGTVFVGGGSGRGPGYASLYAIDAGTGTEKWRLKTRGMVTDVVATDGGSVVFVSWNGYITVVDAKTGSMRWENHIGDTSLTGAAVDNGVVFVGSDENVVYALRLADGTVYWTRETENPVTGSPAVIGDKICLGAGNRLLALDKSSGSTAWQLELDGTIKAAPSFANGTLYVTDVSGNLYAID